MQWTRSAISKLTTIIRSLTDFRETVYFSAGKRTKHVQLSSSGWGNVEEDASYNCRDALVNQTTLADCDARVRLRVYTDACGLVWSGIVSQVSPMHLVISPGNQHHQPRAFLSGHFSGAQLSWCTLGKETYAVMATIDRMYLLLVTPNGFDLFTNHQNLEFLFDSLSVVSNLSKTSLRKVLRWSMRLSAHNYKCGHIKGAESVGVRRRKMDYL